MNQPTQPAQTGIDPSDILTIIEGQARSCRANMADAKLYAARAAGASRLAVPGPANGNGQIPPSEHDRLMSQSNHANMAFNAHLQRLLDATSMLHQWVGMAQQAAQGDGHPPAGRIGS